MGGGGGFSHEPSNESRPCLGRGSHGKLDASKTCMHGRPDMLVAPCGCNKAQGCLLYDVVTRALPYTPVVRAGNMG